MLDPLAAFRRKDSTTEGGADAPPRHTSYVSFQTKDKLRCLDIRTKSGLAHAPGWGYLTNISYNRKTYGEMMLTFNRFMVILKGRNLRPIVDAVKLHTCEFLQEFDAEEFDPPTDASAPFIDTIEVRLFGIATAAEG